MYSQDILINERFQTILSSRTLVKLLQEKSSSFLTQNSSFVHFLNIYLSYRFIFSQMAYNFEGVIFIYVIILSSYSPWAQAFIFCPSGNKIQLPRLPRSKLLIPTQEAQHLSPGDLCWFLFHYEHVHLFIFSCFFLILQIHKLKTLFPLTLPSLSICSLCYLYICMLAGLFIYYLVNRHL